MEDNEERRNIVRKYEQGRDKILNEIDEWEDPQYEIYHVTDRYGFIHDQRLPDKLSVYENKIRVQENSRLLKWRKMLMCWEEYFPNSDKLRKRIYKGIPDAVRGEVWARLLGVQRVIQEQDGKYLEMLIWGLENSPDVRQIDLDVNRTYRNHIMFRERYNTKQQMLFKVLVAYSVYNSEIGYCQGMSQIAALLLMYMNEEESFWSLSLLMSNEKHAMHGFFIPGFPKLIRFARHHDLVTKKFLPKLSKLFKKYDIDSTLYTLKWFFQCFLDRVPFSLTLRLWDSFLLDGEIILTGMSYTLLKLHKRTLVRKGMEELIEFLQIELEKDFGYHDDQAITALQQSVQELRRHGFLIPIEGPSVAELPSRPFGMILNCDNISTTHSYFGNDDQSIVGSIILKPSDSISLAQTSRTESDVGSVSEVDNITALEQWKMERSLSLYDNVDVNESIEAANRLSAINLTENVNISASNLTSISTESNKSVIPNTKLMKDESKDIVVKDVDTSVIHSNNANIESNNESANNESNIISNKFNDAEHYSSNNKQFTSNELINTSLNFSKHKNDEVLPEWPDIATFSQTPNVSSKHDFKSKFEITSNFGKQFDEIDLSFTQNDRSKIENENFSYNKPYISDLVENKTVRPEEYAKPLVNTSNTSDLYIGSRTSPMRTPWKKGSEKRTIMKSSNNSHSTKQSLIPIYISNKQQRSSLSSSQNNTQTRNESNTNTNTTTLERGDSAKLRIFVPYHYDIGNANHDSNKIKLRVDSPTQLNKNDKQTLPTVDT